MQDFILTVSQVRRYPRGHAELSHAEAWVLAQFVKRVGDEMRGNAVWTKVK